MIDGSRINAKSRIMARKGGNASNLFANYYPSTLSNDFADFQPFKINTIQLESKRKTWNGIAFLMRFLPSKPVKH